LSVTQDLTEVLVALYGCPGETVAGSRNVRWPGLWRDMSAFQPGVFPNVECSRRRSGSCPPLTVVNGRTFPVSRSDTDRTSGGHTGTRPTTNGTCPDSETGRSPLWRSGWAATTTRIWAENPCGCGSVSSPVP